MLLCHKMLVDINLSLGRIRSLIAKKLKRNQNAGISRQFNHRLAIIGISNADLLVPINDWNAVDYERNIERQ